MFKRVEKRRLKKEEEEELGLDEDMKEILGMHDTDSEESASDSDGSDDEEDEEEEQEVGGDSAAEGAEDLEGEDGDDSGDENEDEDEDPNVTVSQALVDSIYVVSVQPEVKACIVCPGKLLKGAKMVQLHRISKAHERRLRQFKSLASDAEPEESAWEVLQRGAEEKPKLSLTPFENATSKRAEKKKARAATLKLKREKRKAKLAKEAEKKKKTALIVDASSGSNLEVAMISPPTKPNPGSSKVSKKSKVDATPKPTDSVSPPKKKRKAEQVTDQVPATNNTSDINLRKPKRAKAGRPLRDAPPTEARDSVTTIARSISDRTKSARERALTASNDKSSTKHPKTKSKAVPIS